MKLQSEEKDVDSIMKGTTGFGLPTPVTLYLAMKRVEDTKVAVEFLKIILALL
jgi:hypothetical protein